MAYQAIYTKNALKDLKKFSKSISKRITDKVKFYRLQNDPLSFAKKLTDSRFGDYRFRIGDYRVIFDVDKKGNIKILMILSIKHRREVYKEI